MTSVDFITDLFCRVDDQLDVVKHSQAKLYPSEVVTLAVLYALKGCGQRAFWRWLTRDYQVLFPNLPDRTRSFRLFVSHRHHTQSFMASPTILGVIDSYGIEFIHSIREGRSPQQLGRKGSSNRRWIVGGKLCCLLNKFGLVVDWACDTANVYDGAAFQPLVEAVADQMIVFADRGFQKNDWQPDNLRICARGEWNDRMLVETVLSMLTAISDFKRTHHRVWAYFEAKLAFTMAMFNILAQWDGFPADLTGFVPLSIARFSL